MKAKFISLSKSNQSIKLFVDILDKSQKKNNYQSFKYNNKELFKYSFNLINSQLNFSILPSAINQKKFYKKTIGSFIFDQSNKFSANWLPNTVSPASFSVVIPKLKCF